MAVSETMTAQKVVLKVDDGTTAAGNTKTANVSMGTMKVASIDLDKVGAVAEAMAPVLSSAVVDIVRTPEFSLSLD